MCKLLIAALLAGAVIAPAIAAQPPENKADVQHRGAHQAGEASRSRAGPRNYPSRGVSHAEREATAGAAQAVNPQMQRAPHIQREGRRNVQPSAERRQVAPFSHQPTADEQRAGGVPRSRNRVENRQVSRVTRNPMMEHRQAPAISRVPRIGTEPPLRVERRSRPRPQWNMNWRNDHRYDWNQWRRQHRSVFHLHPYRDPYGWAYQLFTIGWRLWPNYYSSGYWIDDPWAYRLPPAPEGTRWVRYYNDALLVDVWTGEVLDVIHDVFW